MRKGVPASHGPPFARPRQIGAPFPDPASQSPVPGPSPVCSRPGRVSRKKPRPAGLPVGRCGSSGRGRGATAGIAAQPTTRPDASGDFARLWRRPARFRECPLCDVPGPALRSVVRFVAPSLSSPAWRGCAVRPSAASALTTAADAPSSQRRASCIGSQLILTAAFSDRPAIHGIAFSQREAVPIAADRICGVAPSSGILWATWPPCRVPSVWPRPGHESRSVLRTRNPVQGTRDGCAGNTTATTRGGETTDAQSAVVLCCTTKLGTWQQRTKRSSTDHHFHVLLKSPSALEPRTNQHEARTGSGEPIGPRLTYSGPIVTTAVPRRGQLPLSTSPRPTSTMEHADLRLPNAGADSSSWTRCCSAVNPWPVSPAAPASDIRPSRA